MRFIRYLLSCCTFICVSLSAYANNVIVVTDQVHLVQNLPEHARLIRLDAADQYQEKLSQNLPSDPEQAAQIARKRLDAGGQAMQNVLQGILQGAVDAWSLGISKVPAVIVDQRYVVYGQSDVQKALQSIQAHQESQQ